MAQRALWGRERLGPMSGLMDSSSTPHFAARTRFLWGRWRRASCIKWNITGLPNASSPLLQW